METVVAGTPSVLVKAPGHVWVVEISLIVGGKLNSSSPPDTWQTIQKSLNGSGSDLL